MLETNRHILVYRLSDRDILIVYQLSEPVGCDKQAKSSNNLSILLLSACGKLYTLFLEKNRIKALKVCSDSKDSLAHFSESG